jgi:hypothetical protein
MEEIAGWTGYENSLNDLELDIMMLRDLNLQLASNAAETRQRSQLQWIDRMKKQGVYNQVSNIVGQIKGSTDPFALWKYCKEATSRMMKGEDKIASYVFMGVLWPMLRETKYVLFIRQMSLVYLVAQFENYLQNIICLSLAKNPAIAEKKMLSFKELSSFKSVERARKAIFEKEASERVNEGIDGIADYLSGLWGVKLTDYEKWRQFRERFYRRNVLVHNAGRPNQIYREKTGYKGKEATLGVEQQYLADSLVMFGEVAKLLCSKLRS